MKHLKIVHLEDIPLQRNYRDISKSMMKFGNIIEIRMSFLFIVGKWEAWVTFSEQ